MNLPSRCFVLFAALVAGHAVAGEPDPASLYEVQTTGSSQAIKVGEKGKFELVIKTKPEAHISSEAPLKLELSGMNVTPEKTKLTYADSQPFRKEGPEQQWRIFTVPVAADAAGKGAVEAKLTFFVCTDKLCARQQKNISVPVEVK